MRRATASFTRARLLALPVLLVGAMGWVAMGRPELVGTDDTCAATDVPARCEDGWCRIPAGCDVVGSPDGEIGRGAGIEPATRVVLTHAYWMMRYEIVHAEIAGQGFPVHMIDGVDCDACADVSSSYWEALRFANAVSRANGWDECYEVADCTANRCTVRSRFATLYACRGVRLPTEVEWEHAARAGTRSAFYAGDVARPVELACHTDPVADRIAWYCANADGRLHPPGEKAPNRWGLYDMSGNAAEWVDEGLDGTSYRRMPSIDPWGLVTRELELAVTRGGSIASPAIGLRSAARSGAPPWSPSGFRLVRTIFEDDDTKPVLVRKR